MEEEGMSSGFKNMEKENYRSEFTFLSVEGAAKSKSAWMIGTVKIWFNDFNLVAIPIHLILQICPRATSLFPKLGKSPLAGQKFERNEKVYTEDLNDTYFSEWVKV